MSSHSSPTFLPESDPSHPRHSVDHLPPSASTSVLDLNTALERKKEEGWVVGKAGRQENDNDEITSSAKTRVIPKKKKKSKSKSKAGLI
jgi:hypothetical protein